MKLDIKVLGVGCAAETGCKCRQNRILNRCRAFYTVKERRAIRSCAPLFFGYYLFTSGKNILWVFTNSRLCKALMRLSKLT